MKSIIRFTILLGPNKVDWLRTIYFSLFGSASLNFVNKIYVMDFNSAAIYILGDMFLLFGLLFSMRIADVFKRGESDYALLSDRQKAKYSEGPNDYMYIKEKKYMYQYVLLYVGVFLSFICIGVSLYRVDEFSAQKNKIINKKLHQISNELKITNNRLKEK